MTDWKRPKTINSKTEKITTQCGSLFLTLGYEDERLIEVSARIGKNGVCPFILLDSFCKAVSMYVQSDHPRYKIVKKFKKQFVDMSGCETGKFAHEGKEYNCCIDYIAKRVVSELEK